MYIPFIINGMYGQNIQNDVQKLYNKIVSFHDSEKYLEIIGLINDKSDLINKSDKEWREAINSYKYDSQYKIQKKAFQHYEKGDYIQARNILTPIISEIKDSIALNVCNEYCCIPWSLCLWSYGKIHQGLGEIDEALSLLKMNQEYVTNNLECFLSSEEGNYSKYAYVSFWTNLSTTYELAGMYDESIETAKDILEYCRANYYEYLFEALMKVGYSYNALYTNEGLILANKYFLKALDSFTIYDNIEDYERILFLILSNFNQLEDYHKTINVFNRYYSKCRYSIENPISLKNIEVNNLKAIAYKNLNYSIEGSYEETEAIHNRILTFYENNDKTKTLEYATQLRCYADSRRQRDSKLALIYYKKSIDVWNELSIESDNIEYLALLKNILGLLQELDYPKYEFEKIETYIDKCLLMNENIDIYFKIDYYRNQSYYYLSKRDYLKADRFTSLGLDIYKNNDVKIGLKEDYIDFLSQKATILLCLGNSAEADRYCNIAFDELSYLKNRNLVKAELLETLALNFHNNGNLSKSEELENEAISIRIDCGVFNDSKGNIDLDYTLQILRNATLEEKIAICSNIIAKCEEGGRKYDKQLYSIYSIYALSMSEIGRYEKADSLFCSLELSLKKNLFNFKENEFTDILNNFYKDRSIYEAKKNELNLAAYYMEKTGDSFFQKYQILTDYYAYLDNKIQYEANITKSLTSIQNEIYDYFMFLTENERSIFLNESRVNSLKNYGEYAYLMPDSKIGMQKIYDSALLYKGILLYTNREISNIISTSNNDSIKTLYAELQSTKRNNLTDEIIKHKEKSILNFIREKSAYSHLDITWKDIQKNLKSNECAVEFLKFKKNQWVWCNDSVDKKNHYIALVVTPTSESPIYVDLFDESVLEKAYDCGSNLYRNDYGKKLTSLIWKTINEVTTNKDIVYFSPIGLLNLLNIETLSDEKKYIRLSSTRELCKRKSDKIYTAILYGGLVYDENDSINTKQFEDTENIWYNLNDTTTRSNYSYLPGTQLEVNSISRLLKGANVETICLTREKGTIDSFKSISGNSPSVLHIATHGIWNNIDSNVSLDNGGLLFSFSKNNKNVPLNERQNFISAREISRMDFSKTSLAILSACQTGIGKITDDGVWGIQRAFKMAGVQTIMMSLWKVDDLATSLMMTTFYKKLLETGNKHIAFKYAQKKVQEKFENPYYWASFILMD